MPGDFETGSGLENYIDISRGNYRIYFFNTDDNTYIDTFEPFMRPGADNSETINGVQTVYYWQFLGKAPKDLPMRFKLVVAANWPEYPEPAGAETSEGSFSLKKNVTTISDLTGHAKAVFSHMISPEAGEEWLDIEKQRLIPFYGVREYDLHNHVETADISPDDKIEKEIYINLSEDKVGNLTALPLLRAMAKVEVILNNPMAAFASVEIDRVNTSGFCAPDALLHTDYDHGYDWDNDFIQELHLPGGGNLYDESSPVRLSQVAGGYDKDGNPSPGSNFDENGEWVPQKWVAYIPEYRNIGSADSYCSIKVTLSNPDSGNFRNPGEDPADENDTRPVWDAEKQSKRIYFSPGGSEKANKSDIRAERNTDGTFSDGRFNIERNNVYRFTITEMNASLSCELDVQPYADCPLTVDFGLMRDESGDLMVLPDPDGNFPDYFINYMSAKEWPKDIFSGEMLTLHNDEKNNDYYAIHLTEDGTIANAEVWAKDMDGCRILSNFGEADGNEGCSSRMVRDYSTLTVSEYYKDKDGDQRLQHNDDHSSVVLNHEKEMLFKTKPFDGTPDNPLEVKTYPVESLDKDSGKFWYLTAKSQPYIATEENILEALSISGEKYDEEIHTPLIGKKVMTLVFIEGDKTGNDTGAVSVIFEKVEEEDKKEETRNQAR